MGTYNSGVSKTGVSYMVSASRRWANEGYIEGTFYNAFSLYGALEYQLDEKSNVLLSAIYASNRRGRSAALTDETVALKDRVTIPIGEYKRANSETRGPGKSPNRCFYYGIVSKKRFGI